MVAGLGKEQCGWREQVDLNSGLGVDCTFGELGCCEERGSSVEGRSPASVGQLGDVVPFVRETSSLYTEVVCEH